MEALRQIDNPRYNGILFRRTFPRLETADGLIARSKNWYTGYGGHYNDQKHYWTFPSGARIYFGHMEYESDKQQYQGAQFTYIGFDELTEFSESQYMYLFTRCRADIDSGLRCYIRAATNPGGIGHEWVKTRFVTADIVNRVDHFARVNEQDSRVDKAHPDALSRAFYPALLSDNPSADPDYRKRILVNSDPVVIAQLLGGDWDAYSTEGRFYPNWSLENISVEAEYNPDWQVFLGVDDGYAYGRGPGTDSYHPRIVLFGQITPIGGLNIFDEYEAVLELSEKTLDNVLAKPYRMPEAAYVDSSAAELRARIAERGIVIIGATHPVGEGIKNLRRLICDGNGVRLFRVHPRCKGLIRDLPRYRRDEKSLAAKIGEPQAWKVDDHFPDAARYMAHRLRFGI